MSLQKITQEIVDELERFIFLGHIRGRAGKLKDASEHYTAVFEFRVSNEGKVRALFGFLDERKDNYQNTELIFDKHRIPDLEEDLWHITLVSYAGKPKEQELALIGSLYSFKKDLEAYRIRKK